MAALAVTNARLFPRKVPLCSPGFHWSSSGFISTTAPLIATGNRVVAVASEAHPLSATDFYQVLETSDVPAGVFNIVTGKAETLGAELAKHNGVDTVWAFGSRQLSETVERLSTGNLKRVFTDYNLCLIS